MLRSMTGFGRCLVENTHTIQQWEIKSVNSRHLDLKWRLPLAVRSLEPRLEMVVRRFASRGRVDISLILQYAPGDAPAMRFDASQANAILDAVDAGRELPEVLSLMDAMAEYARYHFGEEEALMCVMLGTRKPNIPTYPEDHPLSKVKRN